MKFIFIILLLLLSCSLDFSFKLNRRSTHHSHRYKNAMKDNSPLHQFLEGFLRALNGNSKIISECSIGIDGLNEVSVYEEKNDTTRINFLDDLTVLESIRKTVNPSLDMLCELKAKVLEFFVKIGRKERLLKYLKPYFKDAALRIIKGKSIIGSAIINGVKWVTKTPHEVKNFFKKQFVEMFLPLYEKMRVLRGAMLSFLMKNPLMIKLFVFAKCFKKKMEVMANKRLNDAVSAFVKLVPNLGLNKAWMKLIIGLICGWKEFKQGLKFLLRGLHHLDKESPKKYRSYGIFAAKLCEALSE